MSTSLPKHHRKTLSDPEQAVLSGAGIGGLSAGDVRRIKQSGRPQFRAMPSSAEEEGARIIRYVASDETPDRVGDVIKVSGWNLTHYKKNPVVLWGHDSSTLPPIGKSVNVRRGIGPEGQEALLTSVEFAPKEAYEFAETVYQLSKNGFLNAVSVGFLPRGTVDMTDEERAKLGMPSYGLMYSSADLLEISVVSVPANPSALTTGAKSLVHSGILADREVSRFLKQVPMTQEELSVRLKSKIRGFVDLGAGVPAPAEEPPADVAVVEVSEAGEAPTVEDAASDAAESAVVEERTTPDADEDSGDPGDGDMVMAGSLIRPLADLVEAQTEQAKALTTLIDSISDLTNRIHLMGEATGEAQRGYAAASEASASDAHSDVLDEVDKLTNDFTQRLKRMRS